MTDEELPSDASVSVVERLRGSASTDFGVPETIAEADTRRWTRREGERQTAIMHAAWDYLDQVAAAATPTLAKGPRGGGRDRDPVLQHVLGAEASYGRAFGVKRKEPKLGDTDAIAAMRAAFVEVLITAKGWGPVWVSGCGGWGRWAFRAGTSGDADQRS